MSPEKVVIDTNVFISAALTNGLARQAIAKVLEHFMILQSLQTSEESPILNLELLLTSSVQ